MKLKRMLSSLYNNLYDKKINLQKYIKRVKDKKIKKSIKAPNILSIEETIQLTKENNLSLVRYGDGELKIIDGDGIFFQSHSALLATRLQNILKTSDDKVMVCLPDIFEDLNQFTERGRKYTADIVAERRLKWYSYFDMGKTYGNAFVSRFYSGFKDTRKSEQWLGLLRGLWDNNKLFIIEGEKSRLGVGNDLFNNAKSIRRLLCPAKDAFSNYDEILSSAIKNIADDEIFLIALGPTATVLAYDLSQLGYTALDLGHIDIEYEWYLRNDKEHGKINTKFVSESSDGSIVEDINDPIYAAQIVDRVGVGNEGSC